MKFTNGRPEPSVDKKAALHDFLVDLYLASVPTKLTNDLFDKLLSALQIDMIQDDKENFVFWVKRDVEYLKGEIDRYKELDRSLAMERERSRIEKLHEDQNRKEDIWSKTPTWVYCLASIIFYQIILIIYGR